MNDETKNRLAAMDARKVERAARKAQMEEYQAWQEAARMAAEFAEEIKTETKMTEEPKKTAVAGRWVNTDIGPVWFNPETKTHCLSAEAAKYCQSANAALLTDEDDIWRKDYEAARQFAYHTHALLSMCEKYETMLAVCGVSLQVPEAKALEALSALRENLHTLTDLKIKKLPHNDVVFMSQPKPYGDM